ncbi:hypothetical protein [uncultured Neptuniibacter sp.]|uniref:hypothetical protein n=1 Tax=uncultured Neptuniibacter sp. TaxID=502143 RepID=UPI002608FD37|nr:hypothetical protein [uncultured Neptuniibacter sp.]
MSEPKQGKNTLLLQIIITLAVIVGLGLALYLPELIAQKTPPQSRILTSAPGCSLNTSSCIATHEDQQISVTIKSDNIRSATPLVFEVSLKNISADQVMLDLKGKEMFMGLNQVMMRQVPDSAGLWQAEVTLAVCTTGEMTWITSVITEAEGDLTQANFEFNAH